MEEFNDYQFRINWTSSEPFDPKNETVEVRVTTVGGLEYHAHFTARRFIDSMFEKNRRTGECAGGQYFCMPEMIIVDEINDRTIQATIDDMKANADILNYFTRID